MRLVGYLRVSTGVQLDGLGLPVQEKAIRSWCRQHGHRLAGWHRDEALSGAKDTDARVGLADALNDVEAGRADGIVVYRLDRLSRDVILQEEVLREVWRMGGEVFSTAGGEANLRDVAEQATVQRMRELHGQGESLRGIIAVLEAEGRPAKQGGRWHPKTVAAVLARSGT